MAKILNVSRVAIFQWETGKEIIPLEKLNIYSNYFNVSLDYILQISNVKEYKIINKSIDPKIVGKRLLYTRHKFDITQEELAKKVGKSRSHITNILGILKLPKDVQNMVLENKISMGHARSLSKLENDLEIVNLAHEISDKKLSVRETEDIINNKDMPKKTPIKKHEVYTNQYSNIQSVMREKIGTLVKISNNKVVIPFDSDKDLERILDILNIDINY